MAIVEQVFCVDHNMASVFSSPGDPCRDFLTEGSHEQSREKVLDSLLEGSSKAEFRSASAPVPLPQAGYRAPF